MAEEYFTVYGLRELDETLGMLPKAVGKKVLTQTLLKLGQPIADAARAMAPDDPLTGGNDLRSSIGVGTRLSDRQKGLHRKMFKDDRASAEVFVGAGPVPHAHLQEFGTVHHGPQPYMRPAWDANRMSILDRVADAIWAEIVLAAVKQAKKTAHLR